MERCSSCVMPGTVVPLIDGECHDCREYRKRDTVDWSTQLDRLKQSIKEEPVQTVIGDGNRDFLYTCIRLKELGAEIVAIVIRPMHMTDNGRESLDRLADDVNVVEMGGPNRSLWSLLGESIVGSGDALPVNNFLLNRALAAAGKKAPVFFSADLNLGEHRFLGNYEPWSPRLNAAYLKGLGFYFKKPTFGQWWEHSNTADALDGLLDHFFYRGAGAGRGCREISSDIREGRVKREVGLKFLRECDGKFPWRYGGVGINEIRDSLGLSTQSLLEALDTHTDWNLFDGEKDGRPILKEFANG